jgi:hypothetical protein
VFTKNGKGKIDLRLAGGEVLTGLHGEDSHGCFQDRGGHPLSFSGFLPGIKGAQDVVSGEDITRYPQIMQREQRYKCHAEENLPSSRVPGRTSTNTW